MGYTIVDVLLEMFSFTFLVRAFVVGILVSLCASLLGLSMVMKRYSMIGDGLSHVGFGALAIATAFHAAPLYFSIPIVVAAAFLLLRLSENSKIKGDAAIALISTSSLAIGVVIISQTTGMNTDVCNYMFGSILAMSKSDVYLSIILSITVLVLFVFFYHKIFAITFDESFAKAGGVKTGAYNMLIALLTALTIVLGMRMMGAMLISSLIIFPALSAMRVFKRFKTVTICSAIIAVTCFSIGLVISYLYATPAGASVVLMNIFAFLIFWAISVIIHKNPRRNGMTKKVALASIVALLLITSCGNGKNEAEQAAKVGAKTAEEAELSVPEGVDLVIREKMFIAQVNDVYLNSEDYIGKKIKLEGIFMDMYSGGLRYCFVIRNGPGCCGSDGQVGFEVAWNPPGQFSLERREYPKKNAWVEVQGVLSEYEESGTSFLYLALTDLNVLEKRGAEFVTQ
jgi:zinc transport system permease protein